MKNNKKILYFLIPIVLVFFNFSCAHKYGCNIKVKHKNIIEQDHYTYNSDVSGKQFRFDIYTPRYICSDVEIKQILNKIFQEHANKNGFKSFEIINIYQTKIMDNFEYSVAFK